MPAKKSARIEVRGATAEDLQGTIERIAREGARKLLQAALEAEVDDHFNRYEDLRDEDGHQVVVRNGHSLRRSVLTGVGPVAVRRPRVDERAAKGEQGHHALRPGASMRSATLSVAAVTERYLRNTLSANTKRAGVKPFALTIYPPKWYLACQPGPTCGADGIPCCAREGGWDDQESSPTVF